MRWLLVTLLLLSLGATYPRHRRFLQKTLPVGSSCIPASGTATNYAKWSQALDNAAWTSFASGAAAPTVTANQAVAAPSCASTFNIAGCGQVGVVERVDFPATGIGQFSAIRQSITNSSMEKDAFVYAMAVGADCGIEIGSVTTIDYWTTRTVVSSTWIRISDLAADASANTTIYIGNMGTGTRPDANVGVVTRAACSVYLWQADLHQTGTAERAVKTTDTVPLSQGPGCY